MMDLVTQDYILISLYAFIFVVGVSGNGLVCYIFKFKYKNSLSTFQTLLLYLAVSDILSSIINPALYFYWQITSYKQWHFGRIGCKILPTLTRVTTDISLSILMIITIERCNSICKPYGKRFGKANLRWAIFICFLLSLSSEIPTIIYEQVIPKSTCQVKNATTPAYAYPHIIFHIVKIMLFLTVFVVANYNIYHTFLEQENEKLQIQIDSITIARKNAFVLLVTMSVVFMILVFPRDILHIIYTASWLSPPGIKLTKAVQNLNSCFKILHMCNSICNIFIYARLHNQLTSHMLSKKVYINRDSMFH